MTQCILDMPSYTYALKAQRLLRARGYPCSVKRREKSAQQSCGYSLVISKNCRSAVEILDSYAIPYPQSGDGGAEYDKL